MKAALIRCLETEGECGGTHCFQTIENKEGSLRDITEDIELVGVASCGGCPGQGIKKRAEMIAQAGAEAIILGSCIKLGTPIGYSCPNVEAMKEQIKEMNQEIELIDWTHYESFQEILIDRIKTTNLSNLDRFFTKGLKL